MPQFSLRAVFVLVLLVSLALGAIMSASETVSSGLYWFSMFLPLLATLAAAYFGGTQRAFWIGVAVIAFWSDQSLTGAWFNRPIHGLFVQVMGPAAVTLHARRPEREAYEEMHQTQRYGALTLQ